MVRQLKHHEQRLLRKVDFTSYKSDNKHRDAAVVRRYAIQKPSDYQKYNRICGSLRQIAHKLSNLDPSDPVRRKHEESMLEKLFDVGILGAGGGGGKGKLSDVENKVTVSAFARRRLGVVMTRLSMADTVQAAIKFIEQGHVRVGPEVVTDPAFLVTRQVSFFALPHAGIKWLRRRNMEDFVTWVDSSKIKRNILRYRDKLDDFDLL